MYYFKKELIICIFKYIIGFKLNLTFKRKTCSNGIVNSCCNLLPLRITIFIVNKF